MSEAEMNALGAKIIKAEMLGNDALAGKLKKKLEGAREAKARMEAEGAAAGEDGGQREETVVLTRTDAKGMTRPVHATEVSADLWCLIQICNSIHIISIQEAVSSGGGGRRRKKEKVTTHDKDGKRARYFADDDRHDLKSLFEREKLSTAEDQVRVCCVI